MSDIQNILSKIPLFKNLGLGVIFYIVLSVFIYISFYFFGFFKIFPDGTNITSFDAYWYQNIKNNGYQYAWFQPSNSAFFPLFPYTWKILYFNSLAICCLNFLFFISGIGLLKHYFQFSTSKLLLYLSFPTCIFFFLPYSEAFFFLFSSIFLVGLKKNNQKIIFIGILLASLTRATAMFFIPSIIMMEIINSPNVLNKNMFKNLFLYSFASLLGLLIVVLFQYWQTGEWFAFAKQQMRFWGHVLTIPEFPVISHAAGEKTLWIDGFALFSGATSCFVILIVLIKKIFFRASGFYFSNRPFWFSAFYLCMITLYSLFFNIKSMDAQTNIDSIARYMFSTAFFPVFFIYCLQYFHLSLKHFSAFLLIIIVTLLSIGFLGKPLHFMITSGNESYSFVFFGMLFTYISLHYFSSHIKYGNKIGLMLFSINLVLSAICLNNFISAVWFQ